MKEELEPDGPFGDIDSSPKPDPVQAYQEKLRQLGRFCAVRRLALSEACSSASKSTRTARREKAEGLTSPSRAAHARVDGRGVEAATATAARILIPSAQVAPNVAPSVKP